MHTLLLNRRKLCPVQEIYEVHCDEDSFRTAYSLRLSHFEDSLEKNFAPINYY